MNTHEGYSKKTISNANVLLAGGGDKSLSDFLSGIQYVSASKKIQYKTAADNASWLDLVTLVTTDENVKQTPKTDNANRPLMMINGGTSAGEQISTSMFSIGIYANASTKMITASGFIKTNSDSSHVLLGDGGHKAIGDFATSGHNHDDRYWKMLHPLGARNLLAGTSLTEQTFTYPSSGYIDRLYWRTTTQLDGTIYTLSFWAKSTVSGDKITHHFYSPNTTTDVAPAGVYSHGASDGSCDTTLDTTWKKYWIVYTLTATNALKSVIALRMWNGRGSGTVSIKGVMFEEGNIPHDWSPAPEDLLFKNDIYAWAKAATKPTYTWSEITNKPDAVGSATAPIYWDGSTFLPANAYSTNADTLDNLDSTEFIRIITKNTNNISLNPDDLSLNNTLYRSKGDLINLSGVTWSNKWPVNKPDGGWSLLNISEGGYSRQIAGFYSDDHLYVRSQSYSANGFWTNRNWRKIVFLDEIPAWSLNSTKPSYSWSEITDKPLSGDNGKGPTWGNFVPVQSDGVMEIGKYLDFHNSSNDGVDYAVRLMCLNNNKVVVNLPTSAGTLALTSLIPTVNNASLYILANSTTVKTFTANASSDVTFDIKTGTSNGTINVGGTDVSVYGLGTAAYKNIGYFLYEGRDFIKHNVTLTANVWKRVLQIDNDGGQGVSFLISVMTHHNSDVKCITWYVTTTLSGNITITELTSTQHSTGLKIRVGSSGNYFYNTYVDLLKTSTSANTGEYYIKCIGLNYNCAFTALNTTDIAELTYSKTLLVGSGNLMVITDKVSSSDATIGTTLTEIASISGVKIKAKIGNYLTALDHYKTSPTAGTIGTSSATSGSSVDIPYINVNANGHITGYGTHTHSITGFSLDTHNHDGRYVKDYGGNIDVALYDIPTKHVFSGLNVTDGPTTGWISGLVLGSNWNNNHYLHFLVENGSRWYATRSYANSKMKDWNTFAYLTDIKWSLLADKPNTATRWPKWSEVTERPGNAGNATTPVYWSSYAAVACTSIPWSFISDKPTLFTSGTDYLDFTATVAYNLWNRVAEITSSDSGLGSSFIITIGTHHNSTVCDTTFFCTATYSGNISIREMSGAALSTISIRVGSNNNYPSTIYVDLKSNNTLTSTGLTYTIRIIKLFGASLKKLNTANVSACTYSADATSHTGGAITTPGNMYATDFYTTSDASKKTNIISISNLLPLKSFNWKETGEKSYGFIAQELKAMGLTELVDGEDGNMTVNYNAALSYFLGYLSRKVEELENKIKQLENKK